MPLPEHIKKILGSNATKVLAAFVLATLILIIPKPAFAAEGGLLSTIFGSLGLNFDTLVLAPLAAITYILLTFFSTFLWASGILLNYVIGVTVLNMKETVSALTGINVVWKTIRDIANMTLIFWLLYIAVNTMLDLKGPQKDKIINLLIAAILINFSLFFTKVMIDASNIVTVQFYRAIAPCAQTVRLDGCLSDVFMDALGIPSLFSTNAVSTSGNTQLNTEKLTNSAIIRISLGGSVVILIATFVFFAASILFITRFVLLVLLMAFSPFMFLGALMPGVGKYVKMFWEKFNAQLLFAPVFMMITWVAVKMLGSSNFGSAVGVSGSSMTFASIFTGTNAAAVPLLIKFGVVIGILIAALVTAASLGATGGKAMVGQLKAIGGFVGRNTAARAARRAGGLYTNVESRIKSTKAGRIAATALNFATLGVAQVANEGARASLARVEGSKFGSTKTLAMREKELQAKDALMEKTERENVARAKIRAGMGAAADSPEAAARKQAIQNMEITDDMVRRMGTTGFVNPGLANADFIADVTPAQFDKIMSNAVLSRDQKEKIKNARFAPLKAAMAAGKEDDVKKLIKGMKQKDFEYIGLDPYGRENNDLANRTLTEAMSADQFKEMLDDTHLSSTLKDAMKVTRFQKLGEAIAATDNNAIQEILKKLNEKELEMLSVDMQKDIADKLDLKQFEKVLASDNYKKDDKDALKAKRYGEVINSLKDAEDKDPTISGPADIKIQDKLSRMNNREIAMLDATKHLSHPSVAPHLSSNQFIEGVIKNDKLTDAEKEKVTAERFKLLTDKLATGIHSDIRDKIKVLSDAEIENQTTKTLGDTNFVGNLSQSQYESLMKSNTVAVSKDVLRTARVKGLETRIADPSEVDKLISGTKASDIAKLPGTILTNDKVAPKLTSSILEALVRENMPSADRKAIKVEIEKAYTAAENVKNLMGAKIPPELEATHQWFSERNGRLFSN